MQADILPGTPVDSLPGDSARMLSDLTDAVDRVSELRTTGDVWELAAEFQVQLLAFAGKLLAAIVVLAVFAIVYRAIRSAIQPVLDRSRLEEDATGLLMAMLRFLVIGLGLIVKTVGYNLLRRRIKLFPDLLERGIREFAGIGTRAGAVEHTYGRKLEASVRGTFQAVGPNVSVNDRRVKIVQVIEGIKERCGPLRGIGSSRAGPGLTRWSVTGRAPSSSSTSEPVRATKVGGRSVTSGRTGA